MTREEAINTVRNIYQTDKEKEALEILIPELAESEDERIRKALIKLMTVAGESYVMSATGFKKEQLLAYLEKQKEHSMSAEEVLTRAGLKLYKEGNQWFILSGDIIQEGICGFGFTIDEALYVFLKEVLIMANSPQLIEQKLEWSEEDERIRKALIWHLKADVDFVSNGVTKAECLAYLDKQKAQKQEWSEEDKRILNGIIGLVDHNQHYNVSNKEMLSWLKSLRPSWKPSEEQMKALDIYRKVPLKYSIDREMLDSLYEQLKKL